MFQDDEPAPSRPEPEPDIGDGPFEPLHLPLDIPPPPRPTTVIDTSDDHGPRRRVIIIDQSDIEIDTPPGVIVINLA